MYNSVATPSNIHKRPMTMSSSLIIRIRLFFMVTGLFFCISPAAAIFKTAPGFTAPNQSWQVKAALIRQTAPADEQENEKKIEGLTSRSIKLNQILKQDQIQDQKLAKNITVAIALPRRKTSEPPQRQRTIAKRAPAIKRYKINAGILNSVAFPIGRTAFDGKWRRVANVKLNLRGVKNSARQKVTSLISATQKLPVAQRLKLINQGVNKMLSYKSDRTLYGKIDHWASHKEIIAKGAGDCEDFAILKYAMLREVGISAQQMQLTIVNDGRKNSYHAVLAVHVAGHVYYLDNKSNRLLSTAALTHYKPLLSFSANRKFIHGVKTKHKLASNRKTKATHPYPS